MSETRAVAAESRLAGPASAVQLSRTRVDSLQSWLLGELRVKSGD